MNWQKSCSPLLAHITIITFNDSWSNTLSRGTTLWGLFNLFRSTLSRNRICHKIKSTLGRVIHSAEIKNRIKEHNGYLQQIVATQQCSSSALSNCFSTNFLSCLKDVPINIPAPIISLKPSWILQSTPEIQLNLIVLYTRCKEMGNQEHNKANFEAIYLLAWGFVI